MDPIINPYTPNAGAKPAAMVGREPEIEAFRVLIGRLKLGRTEKSQIITGLRGVGKTVLLNAFADHAEAEGFITAQHELDESTRIGDLIAADVRNALDALSVSSKLSRKLKSALGNLSSFTLTDSAGFRLSFDLRQADAETLSHDFTEVFLHLGEAAAEKGRGVAFLLDEVQFVRSIELQAIIMGLHRCTQKSLPITLVAAGLPQLPGIAGEARSYAERLFDFPRLESLSPTDAAAAIIVPAEKEGVAWEPSAVDLMLELTLGYPFYIQEHGKHTWNVASGSPISAADVVAAKPLTEAALDRSIYHVRIQRATALERRYLRAMAELGDGPFRSGAIAEKLGGGTQAHSRTRESLLKKGLIYATEDYGQLDFTVPRFGEFMQRFMPFAANTTRAQRG